jgi:hypothetical protein
VETKQEVGGISNAAINPTIFSLANSFALDRFAGKNAHSKKFCLNFRAKRNKNHKTKIYVF